MNKDRMKVFLKCILFGVGWAVACIVIAQVMKKVTNYNIKDILFVEGIILIMIGVFSSIGGDPMGLSLEALGNSNAQYVANANLQVANMERKKNNRDMRQVTISMGVSGVALIAGGLISIIINFTI